MGLVHVLKPVIIFLNNIRGGLFGGSSTTWVILCLSILEEISWDCKFATKCVLRNRSVKLFRRPKVGGIAAISG